MSNSVVIKSCSDGISVYLDKDLPFTQLLEEIKMKFIDSEKFFQKAKLAISFEGRKLKDTEERKIIDVIQQIHQCKSYVLLEKMMSIIRYF